MKFLKYLTLAALLAIYGNCDNYNTKKSSKPKPFPPGIEQPINTPEETTGVKGLEYTISQSRQNAYKSAGLETITANLNKPVQELYLQIISSNGGDLSGVYKMTPSGVLIPKKGYEIFIKELVIPPTDNASYSLNVSENNTDFTLASPTQENNNEMVTDTTPPICVAAWTILNPIIQVDIPHWIVNCSEKVYTENPSIPPEENTTPSIKVDSYKHGNYSNSYYINPAYIDNPTFFEIHSVNPWSCCAGATQNWLVSKDFYDKAENKGNITQTDPITWQE